MEKLGRRPALDGLRGVAVAGVVLAHLHLPGGFGQGGMVGVDIFFTLSGFLITSLLLEEIQTSGRVSFRAFARRRAARLLPALTVFLMVTAVCVAALDVDRAATLRALVPAAFYVSNWWIVTGHSAGALGHTWSLAVEEQFYLVWPLLVLLAYRRQRRLVAWIAALGVVVAFADRMTACRSSAPSCVLRVYHSTDTRLDQLMLGALLAVLFNLGVLRRLPRRLATPVGAAALVALLICFGTKTTWASHAYDTWGMTATAILACLLITVVCIHDTGLVARALSWHPLRTLGLVSYGVYLWNELFLVMLRDGTALTPLYRAALILALTAVASTLSWRYVELPVLKRAHAAGGLREAHAASAMPAAPQPLTNRSEDLDASPRSTERTGSETNSRDMAATGAP